MIPPQQVSAFIDRAVAEFDAETLGPEYSPGATSSWDAIVGAWQQFKALVDRLDRAVAEPLAPGAARRLTAAHRLVHDDAYRLAFWLPHVATALTRQRRR